MSDHGEPRFDIQMRCMCAPFSTTRSPTCTSGFKVSVTVLQLGNRPYITIFSTKTHLQGYISQTPGNTPVHTHGNFNPRAQSHHHTNSTSVCLSENLSYEFIIILFSLPLFWTLSLTIIFSGRQQPCILHLLLFPMKQQHCLYPVYHRPLPRIISSPAVSPLSHTLLMCSDACQVRCSSGKPTPVTLHSHCFQTYRYMYMYHSSQSHHKIPHLSNHILTCSWKLPKCFVWPQIILHSSRSYK